MSGHAQAKRARRAAQGGGTEAAGIGTNEASGCADDGRGMGEMSTARRERMDTGTNRGGVVIGIRRYIVADDGAHIDITNCFWCGSRDYLCSQCAAEAKRLPDSAPEERK